MPARANLSKRVSRTPGRPPELPPGAGVLTPPPAARADTEEVTMRRVLIAALATGCLASGAALAQTSVTTTTTSPEVTGAITIAPEKRTVIRQQLRSARPAQIKERVTVGMTVPTEIELVAVPETVVTEVPAVRSYRYFVWNDDVVLVDPSSRRVVHILE
jgi:hypothetical protein